MKTIRSFIAINLSLETARAIGAEQRRLAEACDAAGARVRWVPPQNMHVTMRFLGDITEPMVAALKDALEAVARRTAPFEMRCGGLGAFPDLSRPRVLWIGVDSPGDEITGLHRRVAEVLEETGFRTDDRPFHPHVTVGRVKTPEVDLAGLAAETEPRDPGTTRVADLVCYRSDLRPEGAGYRVMWRLPLKGRPPRFAAKKNPDTSPAPAAGEKERSE